MIASGELFEAVCRKAATPDHSQGRVLIALAHSLHARSLTPSYGPGDHGNLSCRTPDGCLITARQTSKASLQEDQLVHIVGIERSSSGIRLLYEGRLPPSTDAWMHLEIYAQRPDIGAVVHGHDADMLARANAFGVPVTQVSAKTNSVALVDEVRSLAARQDYLITRDHGFIALGATLAEADARLSEWYRRARTSQEPRTP